MFKQRPRGAGLYCEIFLPASTRRMVLKETVRDRDHVPPQLDRNPIPHVITAADAARELDRRLAPRTLREVSLDYLDLTLTMPRARS